VKVLIAPNSLKGSLDAFEVAAAIAEGLAKAIPGAELDQLPIADGGDLTAAVLVRGLGGTMVSADVIDPLGRPIRAEWGLLADGTTAVVEMARASGLALLADSERNPMVATSYGAGELIKAALARGCRRVIVGVGGSATVDGAAGLAEALGVRLLDAKGTPIARGGAGLARLDRIDLSAADPRLATAEMVVACDVDNELLGEAGAARVFGPQKGATPDMVEALEANLGRLADVIERDLGRSVRRMAHGGAAGGMAAGIVGLLGGTLARGIDLILDSLRFDERIEGCDLVVTSEGLLDRQTLGNKGPYGVARAAKRHGVPVVVLAGGLSDEVTSDEFSIFDAIFSICPRPMQLQEAISKTRERMTATAEQVGRLWVASRRASARET
jgi:glycerate 2-kinase